MKKFYLVSLFFMSAFIGISQVCTPTLDPLSRICATPETLTHCTQNGDYSSSTDPALLASYEPVVFNIFYWGINKDDGTSTSPMTEDLALASVADLNIFYNQYNIFFKYYGIDFINSSRFYTISKELSDDCYVGHLFDFVEENNNQYKITNSFNVYVAKGSNFGGAAENYSETSIALKTANVAGSSTLLHEIGHALSLFHTRSGAENTTRDINDPLFNADRQGDCIVDSAANSGFRIDGEYPWINDDCEYVGIETDSEGVPYEIFPEDVKNTMSDAYECVVDLLTVGQAIRMREAIVYDAYGEFAAAETTIASLYEPYAGEYYVAGPSNPPGYKPLFQPGFDISFLDCSCSTNDGADCSLPTPYDDLSFQNNHIVISSHDKYDQNYDDMIHPNHTAIVIDQLESNVARRCYDNWNRAASAGSVTHFLDGVINANVTITAKDSLGINNQNLILDLPNGLYKIERYYNDGSEKQSVILKVNN